MDWSDPNVREHELAKKWAEAEDEIDRFRAENEALRVIADRFCADADIAGEALSIASIEIDSMKDQLERLRVENEALKEIISSGIQKAEGMAADRYSVVRGAFWWRVKVGDGQHTEGRCYTKVESERLAVALRTAFLDGAFVVARHTTLRGEGE